MNSELHFLVVNDDPNMRRVMVALLKEIGYIRVSEAENGEMALRAFDAAKMVGAPIEFVLTDCAMPFMNGLKLIRSIRQNREMSCVPILMVTPRAKRANIIAAVDAGADDYIVRPFNASSLGKKIAHVFARQKQILIGGDACFKAEIQATEHPQVRV